MKTMIVSMALLGLASLSAVSTTASAAEAEQNANAEVRNFQASPEDVLTDPAEMFQVGKEGKAVANPAEKSNKLRVAATNDLRSCGMKYLRDSGSHSVWEAQRPVYVVVDAIRDGRNHGSTTFTVRPPNTLSLMINRDNENYDGVRSCGPTL